MLDYCKGLLGPLETIKNMLGWGRWRGDNIVMEYFGALLELLKTYK